MQRSNAILDGGSEGNWWNEVSANSVAPMLTGQANPEREISCKVTHPNSQNQSTKCGDKLQLFGVVRIMLFLNLVVNSDVTKSDEV